MFRPWGGRLFYILTNLLSLLIIFPILLHNAPNMTWNATSFNSKYPLMCVHTSHQCYKCPIFTLRPWQWAHGHPWWSMRFFYCHHTRWWLPCGMGTTICTFFNHIPLLSLMSWHCVHQRQNLHPSRCCHYQSNTSKFISLILCNLKIYYLRNNSSQRKELLWLTPHWSFPPFSNWGVWMSTNKLMCSYMIVPMLCGTSKS
jgi:hypothetical protein